MIRKFGIPFLLALSLLILAYGARRHESVPAPESHILEAGLLARADAPEDDIFVCSVCLAEGREHEHVRGDMTALDHEGQRYHFCSGGCLKTFRKNPAAFLLALSDYVKGKKALEP